MESDSDFSSGVEEDGGDEHLPEELRDATFGELEDLRSKIGTKKFNTVVAQQQSSGREEKKKFSRTNKNRPVEKSSKKRVSSVRDLSQGKKKKKTRDPRFDDLSGKLNPDLFDKSYEFIKTYREKEKKALQREGKRTTNEFRKSEIVDVLSRLDQQEKKAKQTEKVQAAKRESRKQQNELLRQGKKPFYLKKSDQKKLEIATKFSELKKAKKLDAFVTKKRRRNASHNRKKLPSVDQM